MPGGVEPIHQRQLRDPLPERKVGIPSEGDGLSYQDLVAALRKVEGLRDVGKQYPNFHFRGRPFLHFHEGERGLYADIRLGTRDFQPVWASTPTERANLLDRVQRHVAKTERTRKADRATKDRRR
jgi:hypothetical protein